MSDKQQKIVSMFDEIAPTYDVANRLLSFGIDRGWRKQACDTAFGLLSTAGPLTIVDVACGTGDMLGWWKERGRKQALAVDKFIGIDPSEGMLEIARKKIGYADFLTAKAQVLPLESGCADILSISYGIRNVVERKAALNEFHRVLKPGGLVVILEFTKRGNRGLKDKIVNFYMTKMLPTFGGLVSRNFEAYRYLPNSIEGFLTTAMLEEELSETGFEAQVSRAFSMGISTLLIAKKP